MHCGSEISAGYTGWMWKSLIFAKMNPDWHYLQTPLWGQYRSLFAFVLFFFAMFSFFYFFVHQCAFHLLKIYHNTNGRFHSSLLVCFRLDQTVLTDRKRLCTIISLLNSYCNFLDLIFTQAVKETQPVGCTFSFSLTRVCIYAGPTYRLMACGTCS